MLNVSCTTINAMEKNVVFEVNVLHEVIPELLSVHVMKAGKDVFDQGVV
ncbi:hypothetical protein [Marinobacter sp. NP-4(2019)]|nr:hypothetical protein [Marinobacter sp. NP-4(2019)]